MNAQSGIFALGTPEHAYLEFDLRPGEHAVALVAAVAALADPLSTVGGVNLVLGFRPELWAEVAEPADVPASARSWTEDLVGADGYTMPATQRDAVVWVAGVDRTAVFDNGRAVIDGLAAVAVLRRETTGWHYRQDRDLTGFIDGTENPSLLEAPDVALVPPGQPGAGSSVLLLQMWDHDSDTWERLPVADQERVIGRSKPDSIEIDEALMPADSHVSRTVLEVDGEELPIFRRNVAFGGVSGHGTAFVGFSCDQWRLAEMLRRMAGVGDGVRDALTCYTTPVTGGYYTVPSVTALARFAPPEED
ncbi:Dyp-type peroxidase [Pseudonocardia sp. GCM10023141]|uniref:Dyp-type peroxidase n=1 Tax=Pseudonocardia sp. GCM10023141 TaxID=3252653 RepID=UPI0036192C9C